MNDQTTFDVTKMPLENVADTPAVYSNNVEVSLAPWDLRLLFSEIVMLGSPSGVHKILRANVVMTPGHTKALATALIESIKQYEAVFGEISAPTQRPLSVPAKLANKKKN